MIDIIRRLESRLKDFDMVIIETTGLADPAPVCQTFFVDEKVAEIARLDAVVTVVDARHIIQHLDEVKPDGAENESVEQVAFADRILLNKIDLASEDELIDIEKRIKAINASAPILRANLKIKSCPMDFILGINAFDLDKILSFDPNFLQDVEHMHDQSVSSVGFQFEADLNIRKLNRMISELLREKGTDLLRYKGLLSVRGSKKKFVFQGVHMLFDGTFSDEHLWADGEKHLNKFIFIGKNLNRADIEAKFKECVVDENVKLRFSVGQECFANTEDGWKPGKIVKLWDEGNAYRIKLKGGTTCVWAPEDDDLFVRVAENAKKKIKK